MRLEKLYNVATIALIPIALAYAVCLALGYWGNNTAAYTIGDEILLPLVYVGAGYCMGLIVAKRVARRK